MHTWSDMDMDMAMAVDVCSETSLKCSEPKS